MNKRIGRIQAYKNGGEQVTQHGEQSGGEAKKTPPYTGTTSDGVRTGGGAARPPVRPPSSTSVATGDASARPVKPPSSSFLKPPQLTPEERQASLREELERLTAEADDEPTPVRVPPAPQRRPEGALPAVAEEPEEAMAEPESLPEAASSAEEELLGPPEEEVEAVPVPEPPKRLEVVPADRLNAELSELGDVIANLEALAFLRPRVQKFKTDGADMGALVSVYRLTARTLKDELSEKDKMLEQFRKEFTRMRGQLAEARGSKDKVVEVATPTGADPAEFEALKKELKALQEQLDAAQEQRNRLLQDFQNMRNRVQMDTDLKVHREKESLIRKVLPVVDGFDRALDTVHTATDTAEIARGIEMLFRILHEALAAEGLKLVETGGQPFDPHCHEAVGSVETADMPEDTVFDELSKGYYLGEKLLRPAMVRVAKAIPGQPSPSPEKTESEESASAAENPDSPESPAGEEK